jgi:general secretion pathway protein F
MTCGLRTFEAYRSVVRVWRDALGWAETRRIRLALPEVCDHMSRMLDAGIALADMVRVGAFRPRTASAQLLQRVDDALGQGGTLAVAWQDVAPPLLRLLIMTGEQSGQLGAMLRAWVAHVRSEQEWRRRWTRALSYPAFVLSACLGLIGFITGFVLPQFDRMYTAQGMTQSASTRWMERTLWSLPKVMAAAALLTAAVLCTLMIGAYRQTRWWPDVRERIPGWRWVRLGRTRTLCQVLGMLLTAGVPVVEALTELERTDARWLHKAIVPVKLRILAGSAVSTAFDGKEWDPSLQVMLTVAEKTGDVAEALERAEVTVRLTLEREIGAVLKCIEPAAVFALGAVVAFTMLLLFVPMYDLINSMSLAGARG